MNEWRESKIDNLPRDQIISDIMKGGFRRIEPSMDLGISLSGVYSMKATSFIYDTGNIIFTTSVYLFEDNTERLLRYGFPLHCWGGKDNPDTEAIVRFLEYALNDTVNRVISRQWTDKTIAVCT